MNSKFHNIEKEANIITDGKSYNYNHSDKNETFSKENMIEKITSIPTAISSKVESKQLTIFDSETYKKNLLKLLEGNTKARTWKEKLELINSIILNDVSISSDSKSLNQTSDQKRSTISEKQNNKKSIDLGSLSMLSVYLFFLNTGQIKCAEDGTHFRPNHHANLAFSIFSFLLQNLDDSNSIIIRAILKNIPSFSDHYMASVPLTRIRDIAHRNDIPHDLKQEIKHTLQNKLHRSASPDDLKTCENLIEKIKNGNYSQDFKKEFFIFYEELKEFFNALGVEKSLDRLKDCYKGSIIASNLEEKINKFLSLKGQINLGNNLEKYEKFIALLFSATFLRNDLNKILMQEVQKFGANGNIQIDKTLLQLASTCDIELENYVFTLLSAFINILENNFINNKKSNILNDYNQQLFLDLSKICLKNLIVSNIFIEEASILEEDLEFFILNKNNKFSHEGKLLRIKAVFERCLNLCFNLNNLILEVFTQTSNDVGTNLQINKESIKIYAEAFIRNHTVFQFSKVISIALNMIRQELNLSPFVIISSGVRKGILVHCKNLRDLEILIDSNFKNKEKLNLIAFLDEADGTEELPLQVKCVILGHDLPQLSHLAIRARQNKSVFIAVENKQIYENYLNNFFDKKENYSNINNNKNIKYAVAKALNEFSVSVEISDDDYTNYENEESFVKKESDNDGRKISTCNVDNYISLNNLSTDVTFNKRKESLDSLQKNSLLEKEDTKNLNLIDIEDADYSNCGSKSTNIKKLLKIKEIVEKNKEFVLGNINSSITSSDINIKKSLIDFKIPYSICIPFGIYEFYSRILLNNSEHPNSEYSLSYDLINFDEIINLEKNAVFFREKFIEHLDNFLKLKKKTRNSDNFTSSNSTSSQYENRAEVYFEKIVKNIMEKTNENIKLISTNFPNTDKNLILLAFRSSSNLEDLNKNAGAGLFDSILGIPNNNSDLIKKAIFDVWSSLFTYRALVARRKIGISSKKAKMAILVQEMIRSEFSFVIHTCNPITKDNNEVFIEIAVGLGETLASANQKGSPYRLIYSKKSNQIKIVNFSSFPFAYEIKYEENKIHLKNNTSINKIEYKHRSISYRSEKLSNDENFIINIGIVLGRIGVLIEQNINLKKEGDILADDIIAQDIEGAYANESIYIVQTRPQII